MQPAQYAAPPATLLCAYMHTADRLAAPTDGTHTPNQRHHTQHVHTHARQLNLRTSRSQLANQIVVAISQQIGEPA